MIFIKYQKPLVSIIIPVFNEEKYIKKCIRSLLEQTLRKLEIIVINDGSTDQTLKVISTLPNIKILTIAHSGMSKARNKGVELSKGKILVFLDGDMFYEKNFIEELIRPILNNKSIGTFSTTEYVSNFTNIWARCWNINVGLPINRRIIPQKNDEGTTFRAILKSKFIEKGGFHEKQGYFGDTSISNRFSKAYPVKNAVSYHFNPDNLVDVFFSARWIGRSPKFKQNSRNILKYTVLNSIRVSVNRIINGAPFRFLLFKIIFDLGILVGIIFKNQRQNYSK